MRVCVRVHACVCVLEKFWGILEGDKFQNSVCSSEATVQQRQKRQTGCLFVCG